MANKCEGQDAIPTKCGFLPYVRSVARNARCLHAIKARFVLFRLYVRFAHVLVLVRLETELRQVVFATTRTSSKSPGLHKVPSRSCSVLTPSEHMHSRKHAEVQMHHPCIQSWINESVIQGLFCLIFHLRGGSQSNGFHLGCLYHTCRPTFFLHATRQFAGRKSQFTCT